MSLLGESLLGDHPSHTTILRFFLFSLLFRVCAAVNSCVFFLFFACFAHAAVSGCLQHAGQLAKGVSTVAKGKKVAEVLAVIKHALYKAIHIAAGGKDPDEFNQVRGSPTNEAQFNFFFSHPPADGWT